MAGGSSDAPAADGGETRVGTASAEHTGDDVPAAGYDDLVHRAAAYHDVSRRVVRVTGDRAPEMLQGLITADIGEPGNGAAWPTLILTPKGRVLADAVVIRVGDDLLLDVPEAAWAGLEPHFGRYLPPRFATLEPTELEAVRIRGPEAVERAAELMPPLASLPPTRRRESEGARRGAMRYGEGVALRYDGAGGTGVDLLLPGVELPLPAASADAWEAWRIERGIPLYGRDVSKENLPQETGLVADTTSFSKGCYTGQEVLARIHYRGKVNRHLRGLRAADPDAASDTAAQSTPALAAGDELTDGDRVVGSVTSAVRSPRFGWIGLGYLRRKIGPGDEVAVVAGDAQHPTSERGGTRLRVVELPFE